MQSAWRAPAAASSVTGIAMTTSALSDGRCAAIRIAITSPASPRNGNKAIIRITKRRRITE